MNDNLFDKTTVQYLEDGDVVLVGEGHSGDNAKRAKRLCRRVVDEVGPATLAIEYPDSHIRYHGPGAMGYLSSYGNDFGKPILHIDKGRDGRRNAVDDDYGRFLSDANKFTHPIEKDGDLDPQAITDARARIHDKYGHEAYKAMYTNREVYMTALLREAKDQLATPIVAGVGAFHILALRDIYKSMDIKIPISPDRIFNTATVSEAATV